MLLLLLNNKFDLGGTITNLKFTQTVYVPTVTSLEDVNSVAFLSIALIDKGYMKLIVNGMLYKKLHLTDGETQCFVFDLLNKNSVQNLFRYF